MLSSALHVVCSIFILLPWTCVEIVTVISPMELIKTHERIIDEFDEYILRENIRLDVLKSFLKTYKEDQVNAQENMLNYLGNPINAYILIKRLTSDMSDIEEYIKLGIVNIQRASLNHTDVDYPTLDDVAGAAEAVIRLQTTYRLKAHELANGRIKGVEHSNPMTTADCFELSRALYRLKDYQNSVAWSMEALQKYNEKAPHFFKETELLEQISSSHYLMGNTTTALEWTRKLLELDPNHAQAPRNVPMFEEEITKIKTDLPEQEEVI